jgi:hypothetical protein
MAQGERPPGPGRTISKGEVRQAAARLRNLKGWAHGTAPDELPAVEAAKQALRAEDMYAEGAEAAACAECAAARAGSGDGTALCERHLAEAMGL